MQRSLVNVISFNDSGPKVLTVEKYRESENSPIKKVFTFNEDPDYHFYITSPEKELLTDGVMYMKRDDVKKVKIKYKDLHLQLATIADQYAVKIDPSFKKNYYENMYYVMRDNRVPKRDYDAFHKCPNIHLSDMDLADYYIREYADRYKNEIVPLPIVKGFYDIETDVYNYPKFPEPNEAPCPVSFISYLTDRDKILHSFILILPESESQKDFLKEYKSDPDYLEKIRLEYYPECKELKLNIFEDELELIKSFFETVNTDKPDYMSAWNAYFDFATLFNRIEKLGMDPAEVICPKEFPYKQAYVREDTFHSDVSDRNSTLFALSYSQYIDALYYFATLRKALGKREDYSLEGILLEELGEANTKFKYKGDIRTASYVDYKGFWLYSNYDTYRLYELEEKNKDIDLVDGLSKITVTRFNKVMQKTTSIRNFAAKLLEEKGYVLSNNRNRLEKKEKGEKFKGALVMPPELMEHVGIFINGIQSNSIFDNSLDQDLSAMYPHIILAFNIENNTMLGKILIQRFPELQELVPELLFEGDYITIGNRLLGYPTLESVVDNLDEYLK